MTEHLLLAADLRTEESVLGKPGGLRQCAQHGLFLVSCNVLTGTDGGNRREPQGGSRGAQAARPS